MTLRTISKMVFRNFDLLGRFRIGILREVFDPLLVCSIHHRLHGFQRDSPLDLLLSAVVVFGAANFGDGRDVHADLLLLQVV